MGFLSFLKKKKFWIFLLIFVVFRFAYNVNLRLEGLCSEEELIQRLSSAYPQPTSNIMHDLLQDGLDDFRIFVPKNESELKKFMAENVGIADYDLTRIQDVHIIDYDNRLLSFYPFHRTRIYILSDHHERVYRFWVRRGFKWGNASNSLKL